MNPEELIFRGTTHVVVEEDLKDKLASGKKLRIKLGIDPSGSKLTIGHAVNLWRLKAFQDLGHQIVLINGTFTGQIGDSSDKETERPMLSAEEVLKNMANYGELASRVLDMSKVEVVQNGDWFNDMPLSKFFGLQQLFSVAQMVERDNFAKRIKNGDKVGLHELSYAILQGYDSVEVKADVEIGGNDQLFNILAGRTVQKAHDMEPQNAVIYELLIGSDGKKMSKTSGNCIWIDDSAEEMYGKVMRISDELIIHYYQLATTVPDSEIEAAEKELKNGANPRDVKAKLAFTVAELYHGKESAQSAAEAFDNQFKDRNLPNDIPEIKLKAGDWELAQLLVDTRLTDSKSEARRLISQGAVRINQEKVTSENTEIRSGDVVQAGKRRFIKIA